MVITEDFESSDSGSNPDKTYQFFIVSLYYIMPRKVQGGRRSGASGTFRPGGNSYTNQERSLNVRTLNASRDVNAGNQVTFPDGTSQTTASYFGIDFFPRTHNDDLDGLQYLTQVGPDPTVAPQPISFINLPFNYKIIGLSMSIDSDGLLFDTISTASDYDFQVYTRTAGTDGGGTAVGDVISFDAFDKSTSRSGLFTTPQDITPSKDVAIHLDSDATGIEGNGEYILKLWCQNV